MTYLLTYECTFEKSDFRTTLLTSGKLARAWILSVRGPAAVSTNKSLVHMSLMLADNGFKCRRRACQCKCGLYGIYGADMLGLMRYRGGRYDGRSAVRMHVISPTCKSNLQPQLRLGFFMV
jgi:hypothetical protein